AERVVVSGDDVIYPFGRAVRVHNRDDRDAEAVGLLDGDVLLAHVYDEERVWEPRHVLDARKVLLQSLALAVELDALLLRQLLVAPVRLHRFEVAQPLDRLLHGLEVREQAAEPALVDVELPRPLGLLADGVLRLALGADEEDVAPAVFAHEAGDERDGVAEHLLRLLEVNDVDAVALAEDVLLHLRVPAPDLVAEVDAGLQELFHRDGDCQTKSSSSPDWFRVLAASQGTPSREQPTGARQWTTVFSLQFSVRAPAPTEN